jgi:hypothetical protein
MSVTKRAVALSIGLVAAAACGGSETAAPAGAAPAPEPDATAPAPAPAADAAVEAEAPGERDVVAYAIRRIHLGEADTTGKLDSTAWRAFGRDIDGIASTSMANGECLPVQGAPQSMRTDGNTGFDNSWGRNLLPILLPFLPTPSKSASDAIEAGAPTIVIIVRAGGAIAGAYALADKTLLPSWDGTDVRQYAEEWTDGKDPTAKFPSATIASDVFDSGELPGTANLGLPSFTGGSMTIPMTKLRIRMTLSPDGKTASAGMLSGVFSTKGAQEAIGTMMAAASPDLCSGSTHDGIQESIRQCSDILADGTQDAAKECDGISFGLAFEAVRVKVAQAVAPKEDPAPDPCK